MTARDSSSDVLPVACTPASGSSFGVGTFNVSCTAVDQYGNLASLRFSLVVSKTKGNSLTKIGGGDASQTVQGESLMVEATGYAANTQVQLEMRSDPISLGTATADESGTVRAVVTVPRDAPLGRHTIAVIGLAPDGTPHHVLFGIEVLAWQTTRTRPVYVAQPPESPATEPPATGPLTTGPLATEPPPAGPVTTGPLAYTGLRSVAVLQLALMMIGAGCALAAVARRRRFA